ncbi:MAG: hypothetical protein Q8R79_08800, partial [Legionellaceae bacterium]|nr:hypothetical protein [Legionellaceae bacterium]
KAFKAVNRSPLFGSTPWIDQVGSALKALRYSAVFGKQPWSKQTVAADAFQYFAGYPINAGIHAWITQGEKDYQHLKNNTHKTLTTLAGVAEGTALLIPNIITMAGAGVVGGFNKGGALGSIANFFYGLYKAFTYPFRNARRNLQLLESSDTKNQPAFALLKEDLNDVFQGKLIDWWDKPTSAQTNVTGTTSASTSHHKMHAHLGPQKPGTGLPPKTAPVHSAVFSKGNVFAPPPANAGKNPSNGV